MIAIKFGAAINPVKLSAISQNVATTRLSSPVSNERAKLDRNTAKTQNTLKIGIDFSLKINAVQR